jgi:hypothetical protein
MLWFKKRKSLSEVIEELVQVQKEKAMYKARCLELENGVEKDFGVKIRQEITQVNVSFSLMELSVLHIAICKLMERPLATDDVKYYLDLRVKIEGLLETVKE